MKPKGILDPNEILIKEYDYAAQTAFQANEDRVRFYNYYLAGVGTLIAGGTLVNFENNTHIVMLGLACIVLWFLGIISILKLAKLRASWIESVKAINKIKEFYINDNKELSTAFRWTTKSIPSLTKLWSIAFLTVLTIAFISSLFNSIGWFLIFLAVIDAPLVLLAAFIGIITFVLELLLWKGVSN